MTISEDFAWEEPTPRAGHRAPAAGKWVRALKPLMKRPGKWARIATGTYDQMNNLCSQLRRGVRERPDGFWEFTMRESDESNAIAYARDAERDAR